MKLARLFQPRQPRFWLLVVVNALSLAISWVLRERDLPPSLALVLALFALLNFALGLRLAWELLRLPPADGRAPAQPGQKS